MNAKIAIGASDESIRAAAEDAALNGASALGAVLSGYFAAAGRYPGVLLGPMSLVLCGFGANRALDGRCRQPGLEARRPRGFLTAADVPMAARVGVPVGIAAAMVATGYDKDRKLSLILKAGIAAAKAEGADDRAAFLRRILSSGAGIFSETSGHRPLLHVAGPGQGGLLTAADFRAIPEIDVASSMAPLDEGALLSPPWASEDDSGRPLQLIGAIDAQGSAAVLCYEVATAGVLVNDWEMLAPASAQPVMRGVTRVRAGAPLSAPAPIAIEVDAQGRPTAVRTIASAFASQPGFRVLAPR